MSSWVEPALAERDAAFVASLLRGEDAGPSEIASSRILRDVRSFFAPSGLQVYVKRHFFPFLRVRLRYALRASPVEHEARMLALAGARGFCVPRALGYSAARGLLGPTRAVLVTEGLPEGTSVGAESRFELGERLADAGIYHPDLHGDNARQLPDGTTAVLDFQSARAVQGKLGGRRRERMLARVAFGCSDELGRDELERELAMLHPRSEVERILTAVDALDRARRASRRRHCLRSSTLIERSRTSLLGRRLFVRGFAPPSHWIDERPFRGGSLLASSEEGDCLRLRRRGGLLDVWIDARCRHDPDERIRGWERDRAWLRAWESLYIAAPMGGSNLDSFAAEVLEGTGSAREPGARPAR